MLLDIDVLGSGVEPGVFYKSYCPLVIYFNNNRGS